MRAILIWNTTFLNAYQKLLLRYFIEKIMFFFSFEQKVFSQFLSFAKNV